MKNSFVYRVYCAFIAHNTKLFRDVSLTYFPGILKKPLVWPEIQSLLSKFNNSTVKGPGEKNE